MFVLEPNKCEDDADILAAELKVKVHRSPGTPAAAARDLFGNPYISIQAKALKFEMTADLTDGTRKSLLLNFGQLHRLNDYWSLLYLLYK